MGAGVPKPLVPIAGKPMITHLLESVRESRVDGIPVVVVAPDSVQLFRDTLGNACTFAIQNEQLGTGHAVMSAKEALQGADRVISLYGDHPFISADTLRSLAALHDANPQAIAMLTSTVPNFEAPFDVFRSWGRIIRNDKGEVMAIREAKDCTPEELAVREVNPGIYDFPADWMWQRLPSVKNNNAGGEYYLTDLIAFACTEGVAIATAPADPLDVMGVNTKDELGRAEDVFNGKSLNK